MKWEGQSLFPIKLVQLISDHPLSTSAVFFHAYTQNEDTHFVFNSNWVNHLNCAHSGLFSLYTGIIHWSSDPCCTDSLKTHLTHKKGITPHKTVADMTMFKHTPLHWHLCIHKRPTNIEKQVCRIFSPHWELSPFLSFQSSALPSFSAIKGGEVFQDLSTWSKAIMLINCISIQLRCLHTQITEISTQSPQFQYHRHRSSAVITAKQLRVIVKVWGNNAGPWPPGHSSSNGLIVPGCSLPTYVGVPWIWLVPVGRNQQK